MFLPMSWTSPLTVAITILPFAERAPVRAFSASISGSRIATAFFITRARLHDLRQEHLAAAEQLADDVHAVHQRALDDVERLGVHRQRLGDVGIDEVGDAVDERVREPLAERLRRATTSSSSFFVRRRRRSVAAIASMRSVASGRRFSTRSSTRFAQRRIELLVDRELAGVDDRHVEAGLDRVIEEHRVHRLAHARRRAERERQVRHAARDLRAGELGLDPRAPPR